MSEVDYSDPEQAAEAQRKAEERRRRELTDLRALMSKPHGRRFMWRLLELSGIARQSFDPNSDSVTSFNEGRRWVGNIVWSDLLEACPQEYVKMLRDGKPKD